MENKELIAALDSNIPSDVISHREGAGKRSLSYLEGWYVIDRMNQLFGQGNWGYTTEYELVHSGQDDKKRHVAAYIAKVRLVVEMPDGKKADFADCGYGDGSDYHPGKCHESAVKEAVTDGVKRCARNLGKSMGLALYDKTKEFIDEVPAEKAATPTNPAASEAERSKSIALIKSFATTLVSSKKITVEQLKDKLAAFGVGKPEELSLTQAKEYVTFLKGVK